MDYLKLFLGGLSVILILILALTVVQMQAPPASNLPCPAPLCSSPTPSPAQAPQLQILNAPVVANLNGKPVLMYEIYSANYTVLGLALEKVEVFDDDAGAQ